MVMGVGTKSEIRLVWKSLKSLNPLYGAKEYLLVQEQRMWYYRVAAAIWENGIYDI